MAFAAPDPKRVENDRKRIEQRRLDDLATIKRMKRQARDEDRLAGEIRHCYAAHTPTQVVHARAMIDSHEATTAREAEIARSIDANEICWENIGESRGGGQRRNLYRCLVP